MLLQRIERHLRKGRIAPTRFGRDAVADPCLVFDLRNGRELRPATAPTHQRLSRRDRSPIGRACIVSVEGPLTPRIVSAAAAVAQPVIWTAFGYQFEAASMIAGLCACLMVRIWVSLKDRVSHALALDVTVTGIALLFTAGWIVLNRPAPFYALLSGTGFGALGAGIIAIALSWVKRIDPLAADEDPANAKPPKSSRPAQSDSSRPDGPSHDLDHAP